MLGEGPGRRCCTASSTRWSTTTGPEVDKLQDRLDQLEKEVFEHRSPTLARRILDFKRDVSSLRRVVLPQRDVVGRLARREFPLITEQLGVPVPRRLRSPGAADRRVDVLRDRITSLLDAHLSTVSNQLNAVMKVLTVIATIFMPLTFITGLYGMNVDLPHFGRGTRSSAGSCGIMVAISLGMLVFFRSALDLSGGEARMDESGDWAIHKLALATTLNRTLNPDPTLTA